MKLKDIGIGSQCLNGQDYGNSCGFFHPWILIFKEQTKLLWVEAKVAEVHKFRYTTLAVTGKLMGSKEKQQ